LFRTFRQTLRKALERRPTLRDNEADHRQPGDTTVSPIKRISPRSTDLGDGMLVLRALPTREQRMVGAWCFLDHLGPVDFPPDRGMHVAAHPHIGLQTFTWMIEGEALHHDSLGNRQIIRPGEVNLMTAGHGIAHTEDSVTPGSRLHAVQFWIALPPEAADCPPAFAHHAELPHWQEGPAHFTLLAGSLGGRHAPTHLHSPLLGLDIRSASATELTLPLQADFEYAVLPLSGETSIAGEHFAANEFAYLRSGRETLSITLGAGTQLVLIGGEPFAQPVQMWWNFVAFERDTISLAQADWASGNSRFGPVQSPGENRLTAPPPPWQHTDGGTE
jgi:redox-sensitive bicupin YhaK (pirin superfamily)